MPNGHGGHVRFLPVIVLLVVMGTMLTVYRKAGDPWVFYAGYGLAALLGERFAHHLHRWKMDEYDGAYYSDAGKARVLRIYRIAAAIYGIAAVAAWYFLAG